MSCCPPGSWPALEAQRDSFLGTEITIGDATDVGMGCLKVYMVQPPSSNECNNSSEPRCAILSFQDIFAYNAARAWSVADQLAIDTGCAVLHLDLTSDQPFTGSFDGNDLRDWCLKRSYETFVRPKLLQIVLPYLQKEWPSIHQIGAVGFCWGSYIALQAAADPALALTAVAHFHPSLKIHSWFDPLDPECNTIARQVHTPQLLVVAGNDPDFVGPNGSVFQILQTNHPESCAVVLTDMVHGFVNRGDVAEERVRNGVKAALELATNFLKKHLCDEASTTS